MVINPDEINKLLVVLAIWGVKKFYCKMGFVRPIYCNQ